MGGTEESGARSARVERRCGSCEVGVLHLDGDPDHGDVFYSERQTDSGGTICSRVSRAVSIAGTGAAVVTSEIS
jgi:hypothetical protein